MVYFEEQNVNSDCDITLAEHTATRPGALITRLHFLM